MPKTRTLDLFQITGGSPPLDVLSLRVAFTAAVTLIATAGARSALRCSQPEGYA
jgi:hypothetical protein